MPHDVRDQVVDFLRRWSERAEISVGRFIPWLGVTAERDRKLEEARQQRQLRRQKATYAYAEHPTVELLVNPHGILQNFAA